MKLFNKLDRYIIKQLLATFFISIALIVLIIIVFDVSEKLDDFIEKKATLKGVIFNYYANFIPYFVNLFGYLFFFISVVFLSSKLASRTEVIAILSSGISYNRLLRPFLFSATLIALLNVYLGNFLIPQVNKPRLEFEKNYYRNPYRNINYNMHIQLDKNTQVYVQSYNNLTNKGYKFTKEFFNEKGITKKIYASEIIYDSIKKDWTLIDYYIRGINGKKESLKRGDNIKMNLGVNPIDFNVNAIKVETMTFSELNNFITREEQRGSTMVDTYLVEKYQRMINPLAFIVLTLIGVPLSSRKIRGGTGLHLAFGMALAFTFIMVMKVTTVFATKGIVHPSISILIPIIIYFIISLYLLKKAPK